MQPRRRTRAFTLIELLIAFFVLFLVTFLMYEMLIRGSYSAISGIWRKTTNERLQQAAERFRKALEGASYPSVLTPELNLLDRDENHWVVLKKGSPVTGADLTVGGGEAGEGQYYVLGPGRKDGSDAGPAEDGTLVLVATNHAPARDRMEGLVPPRKEGEYTRFFFWLTDKRPVNRGNLFEAVMDLHFATETGTYPIPGSLDDEDTPVNVPGAGNTSPPDGGTLLVPDVNAVRLRLLDGNAAEADKVPSDDSDSPANPEPATVEIVIRCVEPDGGKATLTKVIEVQPHTGVRYE